MKSNDHIKLYLKFLDIEIPNFIQILGIVSLFSYLSKNLYFSFVIILVTSYLFDRYLLAKFFEFMKNQICDPHSEVNRKKLNDEGLFSTNRKLIPATSIIFFLAASLIAMSLHSF